MEPISYYHASTGAYSSTNPFDTGTGAHAWGMLGTAALSQTVPPSANQYLKDLQKANGGWEWDIGFGTDTNSTALAVQALVASGEPTTSLVILDALTYLKSTQNIADGGFPYNPDGGWPGAENSDTNSTAYVVQALLAAGQDPTTGTWVVASSDPISYLLSMQLPDGSFEWQTGFGSDLLGTRQAIPALLGRSLLSAAADLDQSYVTYLPMTFKRFQ
jgi:prenyltransferase beta subunit